MSPPTTKKPRVKKPRLVKPPKPIRLKILLPPMESEALRALANGDKTRFNEVATTLLRTTLQASGALIIAAQQGCPPVLPQDQGDDGEFVEKILSSEEKPTT